jgi:phosphoserine phosphatase
MRLKRVAAVVFDCDSTLSAIEGIDELAADVRPQVEALTDAAMRGDLALEAVYGRRLELIRPTAAAIAGLGRQYIEAMVPDAAEVVAALGFEKVDVRIMSGGLRPAVLAVAERLGIPADKVAAVDICFDAAGEFTGFETRSPLARAGGKREVMQLWRNEIGGPVMMVGDGATDLETRSVADVFVAYAGVVHRPAVVNAADIVIHSHSLAPVMPLALGGERPRSRAGRAIFDKGLELLDQYYHGFFAHSNNASGQ